MIGPLQINTTATIISGEVRPEDETVKVGLMVEIPRILLMTDQVKITMGGELKVIIQFPDPVRDTSRGA